MGILPYYLLVGFGAGFVVVALLQNLRLAFQSLLMVGKVVVIASLILLITWTVGLWRLPRPVAGLFFGIRRLWQPFQRSVLEWIHSTIR